MSQLAILPGSLTDPPSMVDNIDNIQSNFTELFNAVLVEDTDYLSPTTIADTYVSKDSAAFIAGALSDLSILGDTITAGAFVVGFRYQVVTVGTTDYTLVGAASSAEGVFFTATGIGTGTGTAIEILSYNDADPDNPELQGYVAETVDTLLAAKASIIASGSTALGTTEIADGACATLITVSATGVLTTDVIDIGYNVTPIGLTGYDPSAGAELSIRAYPTAGNVNILVCNRTGAAVTPSAMTVNWKVQR